MNEAREIANALDKFPEVKSTTATLPGTCTLKIDPTVTPVVHGPRRQPQALTEKIKAKLQEMEEMNQITKVAISTDWVSSMVVENKENNLKTEEELTMEKTSTETIEDSEPPVIKKDKIELKYKYRDDQWSPLNQEGSKTYDRDFLLQMQSANKSLEKPADLPTFPDVILDSPIINTDRQQSSLPALRNTFDFMPGYIARSPGGRDRGKQHMGGHQMGGKASSRKHPRNRSMQG